MGVRLDLSKRLSLDEHPVYLSDSAVRLYSDFVLFDPVHFD